MQETQLQFLGQEDPLRNAMDRGAWQASMESQSGVTEYTCAHYQYEVSVCLVISDSL